MQLIGMTVALPQYVPGGQALVHVGRDCVMVSKLSPYVAAGHSSGKCVLSKNASKEAMTSPRASGLACQLHEGWSCVHSKVDMTADGRGSVSIGLWLRGIGFVAARGGLSRRNLQVFEMTDMM